MDLLAISRDLVAADAVTHKGTAAAVGVPRPRSRAAGREIGLHGLKPGGAPFFGPGPLADGAHRVNEYNLLRQLEKAIGFYRR
jgi:acetylornithine deacetylase/succinyl-diaminopimelate desuccinylase-like protein